jgi:hypothetical protein
MVDPYCLAGTGFDSCDEATFADWEQTSEELPDWRTSHRRLVADGQAARLTHA